MILTIIIVISVHRALSASQHLSVPLAPERPSQTNGFSPHRELCAACSEAPGAVQRGGPVLILISTPARDSRQQPSPRVGGGARAAPLTALTKRPEA